MATPLELLTPREDRVDTYLSKIWAPALCGSVAFLTVCFVNFGTKRPVFSGIQKHILWTSGAAFAGKVIDGYRNDYLADRDAVLRHYVELHPEDFPAPERKKYSELFLPWIPVR
ncbi:NADH dehydrogenase [ubiquinone] 1 subunit C2 [Anabrus simplex]|uniref:NADH dehydrogenase [ubiquinone] 1 subunit C2 n=1 Tax=Anabrus simplex TaxID=316456 RepID=UPI0034DD3DD1